ncbi:15369_t:CDS:2, partial [Funneliformis mosseae]
MSKEDRLKLKHPDYWDRDPNTWGNVNDWDIYWIELPHSTTINKRNSHSALADEFRVLKQIYDSTEPAYKIACDLQNGLKGSIIFFLRLRSFDGASKRSWRTLCLIRQPSVEKKRWSERVSVASCELPSHPILQRMENMQNNKVWMKKEQITSLKLDSNLIDLELEIDKATQQGFQIAQQGLQEYADAEFDTMKRERKKIRTGYIWSYGQSPPYN